MVACLVVFNVNVMSFGCFKLIDWIVHVLYLDIGSDPFLFKGHVHDDDLDHLSCGCFCCD